MFTIIQLAAAIPEYSVTVDSANPDEDVTIGVSPTDDFGQGDSATEFTLFYASNTVVTLTAPTTLDSGGVFQAWQTNGVTLTNSPVLSFYMRGYYSLTAVYLSPLAFVKGTYNGLFYDSVGGADPSTAGSFKLTTTTKGRYSGSLQIGNVRYSISGPFDTNGAASTPTITKRKQDSVQVDMQITPDNTDQLTGTVTVTSTNDDVTSCDLVADRATFDGKSMVPSQQGLYTMTIPGSDDSSSAPGGDGYGTVSVSKAGVIHFAGALADGTKVSQGAYLAPDGRWPLYVPLYSGQGLILSWITLGSAETGDLSGDMAWIKLTSNAKYYPDEFSLEPTVGGSRYAHPAKSTTVLPFNLGEIVLSEADFTTPLTNYVTLNFDNSVKSTNHAGMSISLGSGTFSGHVINPATDKSISFKGVMLTNSGIGDGFFLGTSESGQVLFQAR